MVSHLADEMFRLFPEMKDLVSEGDDQLPYVLMSDFVHLLESKAHPELPSEILGRVLEFKLWCENQPRGADAGTDTLTIFVVGFFESVLESDKLRYLVPKLISKMDLVNGRDYLMSWVGEDNYRRALALYESEH
jgi:hypothetical protein